MQQNLEKVYKTMGQYQLIKEIGHGQFARVYYSRTNTEPSEEFAIKMFSIDQLKPENEELIDKEIAILLKLNHPNIIKLKEYKRTTNHVYLVFEYCELGDLENYMKRYHEGRFPLNFVQKIVCQISKAFKEIRRLKIVHRDLKLANILINKDLVVKLGDFGFAKHFEDNSLLYSYCGTPITMAPEILKRQNYNEKCDIWSLGVIVYQMIYGKLPFYPPKGSYIQDLINIIETNKIEFESVFISEELKSLIMGMLEVNPNKRISFEQFFDHPWVNQDQSIISIKQKQNRALKYIQQHIFKTLCADLKAYFIHIQDIKETSLELYNDTNSCFGQYCAWACLLMLLLKTVKTLQNSIEIRLILQGNTQEIFKLAFPKHISDQLKEQCKQIADLISQYVIENMEQQNSNDVYNMLFINLLNYADYQLVNEYITAPEQKEKFYLRCMKMCDIMLNCQINAFKKIVIKVNGDEQIQIYKEDIQAIVQIPIEEEKEEFFNCNLIQFCEEECINIYLDGFVLKKEEIMMQYDIYKDRYENSLKK